MCSPLDQLFEPLAGFSYEGKQLPDSSRVAVFIDGQNFYHSVRERLSFRHPNFDVEKIANLCVLKIPHVSQIKQVRLGYVRFYTGIHESSRNSKLHNFWTKKLAVIGSRPNTKVFSRALRYTNSKISVDGNRTSVFVAREKGIDVRIAIDMLNGALYDQYDIAVLVSLDNDFIEVFKEIDERVQVNTGRSILLACAYPVVTGKEHGISANCRWLKITKEEYSSCIDPITYVDGMNPYEETNPDVDDENEDAVG